MNICVYRALNLSLEACGARGVGKVYFAKLKDIDVNELRVICLRSD